MRCLWFCNPPSFMAFFLKPLLEKSDVTKGLIAFCNVTPQYIWRQEDLCSIGSRLSKSFAIVDFEVCVPFLNTVPEHYLASTREENKQKNPMHCRKARRLHTRASQQRHVLRVSRIIMS
jgi:hypothetical protein